MSMASPGGGGASWASGARPSELKKKPKSPRAASPSAARSVNAADMAVFAPVKPPNAVQASSPSAARSVNAADMAVFAPVKPPNAVQASPSNTRSISGGGGAALARAPSPNAIQAKRSLDPKAAERGTPTGAGTSQVQAKRSFDPSSSSAERGTSPGAGASQVQAKRSLDPSRSSERGTSPGGKAGSAGKAAPAAGEGSGAGKAAPAAGGGGSGASKAAPAAAGGSAGGADEEKAAPAGGDTYSREGTPTSLSYPNLEGTLTAGQVVYLEPKVTLKKTVMKKGSEAMKLWDAFLRQAYEFSELFNGPQVLDEKALKKLWLETANAPSSDRVELAVHGFLTQGIPADEDEDNYFMNFAVPEGAKVSKWKKARFLCFLHRLRGSAVTKMRYSVRPPLPEGLVLASVTGVISGKPFEETDEETYEIFAELHGKGVSTKVTFKIVDEVGPAKFSYPEFSIIHTGAPVSFKPIVEGNIDKWKIRDKLPAGLVFDSSTGTITGVATEAAPERSYTVLAKNGMGTSNTTLKFQVIMAPPSELDYHEESDFSHSLCGVNLPTFFPVGQRLRLVPSVEGEVTSFSITPDLPAGLKFDTKTGVISGTPTESNGGLRFTVQAENASGNEKKQLRFGIKVVEEAFFRYPDHDDVFCVGERLNLEARFEGGVKSFTVEPPLPAGISIDQNTGTISGTFKEATERTTYTVIASTQGGASGADQDTTTVVTFKVASPAPKGLRYRMAAKDYIVGQSLLLEPELMSGAATSYTVSPALPAGLSISKETGVISGSPSDAAPMKDYRVVGSNSSGEATCVLKFSVTAVVRQEVRPSKIDRSVSRVSRISAFSAFAFDLEGLGAFGDDIEQIKKVSEMPEEPDRLNLPTNWMLWIVHRAMLDDPNLTSVNFSQLRMPLASEEPRVSLKLMKALAINNNITSLELVSSNLRAKEGIELAAALRVNTTLQKVNLDGNYLDADAVYEIATALAESPDSKVTSFSCSNQVGFGMHMGKRVEEAIVNMAENSKVLTSLGFAFKDARLLNVVDKALRRNRDAPRRNKARFGVNKKVEEKTFDSLQLTQAPSRPAVEVFGKLDARIGVCSQYVAEFKKVPTREQLQAYAKRNGTTLKYSEVAPMIKLFRKTLLESMLKTQVVALQPSQDNVSGLLALAVEKNQTWVLSIIHTQALSYNLTSKKEISIDVSDDVVAWLRPPEEDEPA